MQILFEDNHLIAVNKKPGELAQGDKTGDDSLSDSLKQYIKEKYQKPGDVFLGTIHRLDRPNGKYSVKKIIEKMKEFKGNCIIQTMFLKGSYLGKDMDNTSDKFVLPWLEAVKEIAPRQVMIYTIDRETPDHDLQKATHEELDRIVELIKKAGIPATASY